MAPRRNTTFPQRSPSSLVALENGLPSLVFKSAHFPFQSNHSFPHARRATLSRSLMYNTARPPRVRSLASKRGAP